MAVSLQRWDLPFQISAFFQHILMIRIHVTMLKTTDSASRCDDMTLAKIQKLLSLNGWENVMDGDKVTFHEIWRMGSEIMIKWSCTLQNRKRMKDMKGKIRHYHEDFWKKYLIKILNGLNLQPNSESYSQLKFNIIICRWYVMIVRYCSH